MRVACETAKMGALHAVTTALTVQIAGASTSHAANSWKAYEETLRSPPVPTNYSVTSVRAHSVVACQSSGSHLRRNCFREEQVTPRRVPVLGIGPDGRPQMLTVTGRNFSSLAGLPLYCWLSESNCGWHWTLIMNYLNTTARLINDTSIECPAPPFPLGGRATLSVFPDRPYHRVDSTSPGLRAAQFSAPAVENVWPPLRDPGRHVGIGQPLPTADATPGYNAHMAACVAQDLSIADSLSYEGYSNPWAEPLSVGVEYVPLFTMATARFPYTTGSPSEILLTVAPEVRSDVASDLQVTIVLLPTDGGVNLTLAADVHVEAGRTTRVSFDLSLVAGRWEKALSNATAVLSGIVGRGTTRSQIASTYCRFLFAGPPIPSQIITDHASGALLGEGDTKISVQGWCELPTIPCTKCGSCSSELVVWRIVRLHNYARLTPWLPLMLRYQGWSKFQNKRIIQMTDRASYRGANSVLASGMPGCVQLHGANTNASLANEQWQLNDARLDDAIAFIRHAHSVGLYVIADVTTLWPLQGTVGYNGSDCCTSNTCPCYPNSGPHGNQSLIALMRHQIGRLRDTPGLLGYTTASAGLWFTSSAYTLYQVLKTVDPYHPTMLVSRL